MTDEQTEQAVLKYLHADSNEKRDFQSLTTIFEMIMKPREPRADAYDLDDEIDSKEELHSLLNSMVEDGLLESEWGQRDYEASYRLTDEGAYEASGFGEYVIQPPSNAILTEAGEPLVTEDGDFIVTEANDVSDETPITINSAAWTGLTKTIIDARNAKVVSSLIDKALISLPDSKAGNFQIMQATAYLKAAKELVDAPEPPSEEIWRLIGRAADIVGLLAVFFAIFIQAKS